ncbi:hypothetical protein GCM10028778_27240 [Barrientosiimonas marina]|uniref:YheC/YheD family protein n=1 Tax=Lentibacillus kimchii TaxID=1542911 RepID=A0ABW2UXB8_9BACI
MSALTGQQEKQVINLSQTLLEAGEHLHTLVKAKEIQQSIFTLSSLVDGIAAIRPAIKEVQDPDLSGQIDKLEQHVLNMTRLLQAGNLAEISGMLQFTVRPLIKSIYTTLNAEIGSTTEPDKPCAIGVFAAFRNPLDIYTDERIQAMVEASEQQHAQLYFFTSADVDFAEQTIAADTYQNGGWQRVTASFPDVINNVGTGQRAHAERKLRRMIPFTTFHVDNKLFLPKRMLQYRQYADLLVPFQPCRSIKGIHDFMDKHARVVFKALGSNRGENIFFVTKTGKRYHVQAHKKEQILGQDDFDKWLENVILKKQGGYIVQRYIHTRTKDDEPYHIRAHVQKDGEGKWVLTHIYPRIGNKRSNLSNVATDGHVEDFHTFLQQEYGEQLGATYEQDILELSLNVTRHLDKLYNLALDELGLDFAIDENGRYWMHEANNGPQTAFHEAKRAVNTVAYAKYIAENGIVRTEPRNNNSQQFQARRADLPVMQDTDQPSVALLTGKLVYDNLTRDMIAKAADEGITLFSFTPADIDADEMLIRGHFYEDDAWVPKIVSYPDVIMDRLKLRGNANASWIYEELETSLFTNEWPGLRHTRSELYEQLQSADPETTMAPWQRVGSTRDIFRFIETYGSILLKPEQGPARGNTQRAEKRADGQMTISQGNTSQTFNELPLRHKWNEWLKKKRLVVLQDTRSQTDEGTPFTIYTHASRLNGTWQLVDGFAETARQTAPGEFLAQQYETDTADQLEQQIERLTIQTAEQMRHIYGEVITEMACHISIDSEGVLNVLDIRPNGPEVMFDTEAIAASIITYTKDMTQNMEVN